jgi:hypothetical protein
LPYPFWCTRETSRKTPYVHHPVIIHGGDLFFFARKNKPNEHTVHRDKPYLVCWAQAPVPRRSCMATEIRSPCTVRRHTDTHKLPPPPSGTCRCRRRSRASSARRARTSRTPPPPWPSTTPRTTACRARAGTTAARGAPRSARRAAATATTAARRRRRRSCAAPAPSPAAATAPRARCARTAPPARAAAARASRRTAPRSSHATVCRITVRSLSLCAGRVRGGLVRGRRRVAVLAVPRGHGVGGRRRRVRGLRRRRRLQRQPSRELQHVWPRVLHERRWCHYSHRVQSLPWGLLLRWLLNVHPLSDWHVVARWFS